MERDMTRRASCVSSTIRTQWAAIHGMGPDPIEAATANSQIITVKQGNLEEKHLLKTENLN